MLSRNRKINCRANRSDTSYTKLQRQINQSNR